MPMTGRPPGWAALALVALVVASCGTRLSQGQIVSAASGVRTAKATPAQGSAADAGATADAVTGGESGGIAGAGGASAGVAVGVGTASGGAGSGVVSGGVRTGPRSGGSNASGGGGTPTGDPRVRPATGSTVMLGNIGTYSGVIGALFTSGQAMAKVWAAWANDHGGLNGHRVQILTADDGGDPGKSLSEAKDMVENQHVIAFMGNLVPLSASGALQYLQQKNIPAVGGDSTSNAWFQSPIMFPDATAFQYFAPAAALQVSKSGKSAAAILYCAEVEACHTWNNSLQGGVAQRSGVQLVYTAQVSLAQPDFTAECLQAQSHGAQAILAAVDANSLVRLGRSCAQQNYHPMYIAVSLAVVDSVATDPNLQGLVAPQGTFPWPANDTAAAQDYQNAIRQYAPGLQGSGASSSVWTSGTLMQTAAAKLPANPTSQDILNGLWSIKNNNLGGLAPPLTYNQGQGAIGSSCYFLVEVRGGKWTAPYGSRASCL